MSSANFEEIYQRRHEAAVKLLLDMGSDINAQIETNRNTALTLACFQVKLQID